MSPIYICICIYVFAICGLIYQKTSPKYKDLTYTPTKLAFTFGILPSAVTTTAIFSSFIHKSFLAKIIILSIMLIPIILTGLWLAILKAAHNPLLEIEKERGTIKLLRYYSILCAVIIATYFITS